MTNSYAINTTRGKEFEVEKELESLGLKPWAPRRRDSRYVKEKREAIWYDKPYIHKLIFCVIPAIYWPDVTGLKHVIGKPIQLTRMDIEGVPAHVKRKDGAKVPAVPGLSQFQASVAAEYDDTKRLEVNSEYQCRYVPGQALEMLSGPFDGFRAEFHDVIKRAHDEYAKLRVSVSVFGRETMVEIDPDKVRVSE